MINKARKAVANAERRRWLHSGGRVLLAGAMPALIPSGALADSQAAAPADGAANPVGADGSADRAVLADDDFAPVVPGYAMKFPRDFGAHPNFRTEWWYLTAWLDHPDGPLGMQLTFFRSRTPYGQENPSRFAPRQLVLAHAAIADPSLGALRHADQAFRADGASARYSTTDTDVAIGPASSHWTFVRDAEDVYQMNVRAKDFGFSMSARATEHFIDPALQGVGGFSSKGPEPSQASYYYSRPQLALSGDVTIGSETRTVEGTGWLDQEWSSEILAPEASGWDWVGLNFDNGDALMAFQMRRKGGGVLHSTAKYFESAEATGSSSAGATREVQFTVLRTWKSARTGADYPISLRIQAGELDITLAPLFDDQELDARRSTGIIYWEGAVRVHATATAKLQNGAMGKAIGRGYLELTGYANELAL